MENRYKVQCTGEIGFTVPEPRNTAYNNLHILNKDKKIPNIYRLFESIEISVSPIVSLHIISITELSLNIP